MRERVLRLADLLFGTSLPPGAFRRPALVRYATVVAASLLVIAARRPDAIVRAQFRGEAGRAFFAEQLALGFPGAVAHLHYGLPYLAARILALLGSLVPTVHVPLVYNVGTMTMTAASMGALALPAFRHLVRSDGLRVAVCLAAMLLPANQDLLIAPPSLGFFVLVFLLLLSLLPTPRSAVGVAAWCTTGALTVCSTQAAPLAAPLWLLRGLRGAIRREPRDVAFAVVQLTVLVALTFVAHVAMEAGKRAGQAPAFDVHAGDVVAALRTLGPILAVAFDAALLPDAAVEWLRARGTLAVAAPGALAAVAVALAFRGLAPRGRVTVGLALYLFASSLLLVVAGRPVIAQSLEGRLPVAVPLLALLGTRHRALANVALLLLAAAIVDASARRRARVATATVAALALAVGWLPGFRVPPDPDCHWPLWAARLDRKLASGSREPLVIPSCPPFFDIVIDGPPPSPP